MFYKYGMGFLINPYIYGSAASLLLDDYPAEQAYSVRLLRTAYSGALVRIRRSSDSAEKDFYPDGSNKLSMTSEDGAGTSLSTWISTDSGYITKWYNQGSDGSGDDVVQTTAANQPRIVNAGSIETKGGETAIYFAGTNDRLTTTITNVPEPFSVFGVGTNESSATIGTISSTRSGASQEGYSMFVDRRTNKVHSNIDEGASATQLLYPSQINDANQRLLTLILDSSLNGEAWHDGSSVDTHTYGSSIAGSNSFSIGAQAINSTYLTGYIQEVIFYHTDETSNRTQIELDINNHYSIY